MSLTAKELLKKINTSKTMKELPYKIEMMVDGGYRSSIEDITVKDIKEETEHVIWDLEVQIEQEISDYESYYRVVVKDLNSTKRFYNKYLK